jgi:hypothetical protein
VLAIQPDARLRERLNWDGSLPFDAFLALWAQTMRDRDWRLREGSHHGRQAHGYRTSSLGCPPRPRPVAVVTHGGITVDLLRNLLGDDAVTPHVLTAGIPTHAITAQSTT